MTARELITEVLTSSRGQSMDELRSTNARLVRMLQHALNAVTYRATQSCEASAWANIPEDGVARCLDPEYVDVNVNPGWPHNPDAAQTKLVRCDPCAMRHCLAAIEAECE